MPTGLEVFSQFGDTLISITDRITKVLFAGTVPISGQTNTFTLTDAAFLHGTPFVHCHLSNSIASNEVLETYTCMDVTHALNGTTLTVSYGYTTSAAYSSSYKHPLFLVIGVY